MRQLQDEILKWHQPPQFAERIHESLCQSECDIGRDFAFYRIFVFPVRFGAALEIRGAESLGSGVQSQDQPAMERHLRVHLSVFPAASALLVALDILQRPRFLILSGCFGVPFFPSGDSGVHIPIQEEAQLLLPVGAKIQHFIHLSGVGQLGSGQQQLRGLVRIRLLFRFGGRVFHGQQ